MLKKPKCKQKKEPMYNLLYLLRPKTLTSGIDRNV